MTIPRLVPSRFPTPTQVRILLHLLTYPLAPLLALLLSLGAAAPAFAEKRLSCEELRQIGQDITITMSYLQGEAIHDAPGEGEVDRALRVMVDELDELAKDDPDPELAAAVKALDKAWEDMDGDAYEAALERARGAHGRILGRRCK